MKPGGVHSGPYPAAGTVQPLDEGTGWQAKRGGRLPVAEPVDVDQLDGRPQRWRQVAEATVGSGVERVGETDGLGAWLRGAGDPFEVTGRFPPPGVPAATAHASLAHEREQPLPESLTVEAADGIKGLAQSLVDEVLGVSVIVGEGARHLQEQIEFRHDQRGEDVLAPGGRHADPPILNRSFQNCHTRLPVSEDQRTGLGMGRRRSYESGAVVNAARDLFWERGYELTSVGDVEQCTGLNRSSLYQEFGSKRGLFNAALDRYLEEVTGERLSGLQGPDAGPTAVSEFFTRLASSFRADPEGAARGCLVLNSIAELGGRDPEFTGVAAAHRDRLREAFAAALGAGDRGNRAAVIGSRAKLLAAATMGVFLTARIDPADAADLCDALAGEVATWLSPTPARRRARSTPRR